jgi:2-iminobutanoate/2-iminopropanoate deaminase
MGGFEMRQAVKTHLPSENVPIEWATTADGILYTAQNPIREDGTIETGDITKQATLTLDNLKRTVEAAGGSMDDVTQVLVYLTSPDVFAGMNAVYQ